MGWMKTAEALSMLPELLIKRRVSFNFDGIPLTAGHLSLKKKANLLQAGLDMLTGTSRPLSLPPIIQLELTNICNLRCPLCPTGSRTLARPKGMMSLDTFRDLMDEIGDTLIATYLFCFGEPFMNPHLFEMISALDRRGITSLTSTNGHFCQTKDEASRLVESGLNVLIIAVDGSTQEVYQSYRIGGDIERVKRFITLVEEAKTRLSTPYPYTVMRTVVTRDNAPDLQHLEEMARGLGVNMFTYKSVGCMTHASAFAGYQPNNQRLRRFEYAGAEMKTAKLIRCPFAFRQPIVFWDGTVVGCEYDHDREMAFGKVGEDPFPLIWNSRKAQMLRKSIRKRRDRPRFCSRCPYQDRVTEGTALFCKELRPLKPGDRAGAHPAL